MPKRIMESPLDEALDAAKRDGNWLAKRLGVTISEVSRWRRGRVTPLPSTQARIAKALGVKVESLWPEGW
jgi:lambda repressor-like predicted transcriptional regulator